MADERTSLDVFAENFAAIVEKHCKYIVVSGFVVIAHGRSRGTEDIDMIIERIGKQAFIDLHNELIANGFVCLQSHNADEIYDTYLIKNLSVRYIKNGEYLPEMELKLAKDIIDELQLATRKKLPFTGLGLWFSGIEMNIAFKEELLKSDKDIKDANHLRIIYKNEIMEAEIERIKKLIRELRMK